MLSFATLLVSQSLVFTAPVSQSPAALERPGVLLAQTHEDEGKGKPAGSKHSGGERGTTGMLNRQKGTPGSSTSPAPSATPSTSETATQPAAERAPAGTTSAPPRARGRKGTPRGSGDTPTTGKNYGSPSATAAPPAGVDKDTSPVQGAATGAGAPGTTATHGNSGEKAHHQPPGKGSNPQGGDRR